MAAILLSTEVRDRDGQSAAYRIASDCIEASAIFLLNAIGPLAARKRCAGTRDPLETHIAFLCQKRANTKLDIELSH
jgi:hypothetical protein